MCEKVNVRFYCHDCDSTNCLFWKYLGYINDSSKQGCSRDILIDDFEKYYHYINEVRPFWKIMKNQDLVNEQYSEIIQFLEKNIFDKPIKNFYNNKSKVIPVKEIKDDCWKC